MFSNELLEFIRSDIPFCGKRKMFCVVDKEGDIILRLYLRKGLLNIKDQGMFTAIVIAAISVHPPYNGYRLGTNIIELIHSFNDTVATVVEIVHNPGLRQYLTEQDYICYDTVDNSYLKETGLGVQALR